MKILYKMKRVAFLHKGHYAEQQPFGFVGFQAYCDN